jgi:hypothetical protein
MENTVLHDEDKQSILTNENSSEKVKQSIDEGKENADQLYKRDSKCGAVVE